VADFVVLMMSGLFMSI